MTDNTSRKSIIAPYIDGVLDEKHSHGYSYRSEELVLNRFDDYCVVFCNPFLQKVAE